MSVEERQLRADAERNRRRLLEAAQALFRERGLDVGVAEIAQVAGVGRGTLFRNFASKEDLIAAIVVERVQEAVLRGETLLAASDPAEALFQFLGELVGRQQLDRALFEAVADEWLVNDEIRGAHARMVGVMDALLTRAQSGGEVRDDIGAMDVLMLLKGTCEAASAFAHVDARIIDRQLDLVRAALSVPASARPLRGRPPTLEEIEGAAPQTGARRTGSAAERSQVL
jgi:AcrR family transcriptional regulator